jgi:hypothetical protein
MRIVGVAAACALAAWAAAAASSSRALASCGPGQLTVTGSLQGATQSLLGTVTVANYTARACALPAAPSKVSLRVGTKVLGTVTVRMRKAMEPPGVAVRSVAAHQRVLVGIQWRNWCGKPTGKVRLSIELRIYSALPRTAPHKSRTPACLSHKDPSRVAVSRFKLTPP